MTNSCGRVGRPKPFLKILYYWHIFQIRLFHKHAHFLPTEWTDPRDWGWLLELLDPLKLLDVYEKLRWVITLSSWYLYLYRKISIWTCFVGLPERYYIKRSIQWKGLTFSVFYNGKWEKSSIIFYPFKLSMYYKVETHDDSPRKMAQIVTTFCFTTILIQETSVF